MRSAIENLPWIVDQDSATIFDADHAEQITTLDFTRHGIERAAFIVQRVNAHVGLVGALELALPYLAAKATDAEGYRIVRDIRKVLDNAR